MDDTTRQRLIALVSRFGSGLADDARRCEGLLRDVCNGEAHRRHVAVLAAVVRCGAAGELASSVAGGNMGGASSPSPVVLDRLATRLTADFGIADDLARWAVVSWAIALGVVSQDDRDPAEVWTREDPTTVSSNQDAAAATLLDVEFEPDVARGACEGMLIHVRVRTSELAGRNGWVAAYFESVDGTPLLDANGRFRSSSGQVSAGQVLPPADLPGEWSDLHLLVPYAELHFPPGRPFEGRFYVEVFGQEAARTSWIPLARSTRHRFAWPITGTSSTTGPSHR